MSKTYNPERHDDRPGHSNPSSNVPQARILLADCLNMLYEQEPGTAEAVNKEVKGMLEEALPMLYRSVPAGHNRTPRNKQVKLDRLQRNEIRDLFYDERFAWPEDRIARRFKVNQSRISRILNYRAAYENDRDKWRASYDAGTLQRP